MFVLFYVPHASPCNRADVPWSFKRLLSLHPLTIFTVFRLVISTTRHSRRLLKRHSPRRNRRRWIILTCLRPRLTSRDIRHPGTRKTGKWIDEELTFDGAEIIVIIIARSIMLPTLFKRDSNFFLFFFFCNFNFVETKRASSLLMEIKRLFNHLRRVVDWIALLIEKNFF